MSIRTVVHVFIVSLLATIHLQASDIRASHVASYLFKDMELPDTHQTHSVRTVNLDLDIDEPKTPKELLDETLNLVPKEFDEELCNRLNESHLPNTIQGREDFVSHILTYPLKDGVTFPLEGKEGYKIRFRHGISKERELGSFWNDINSESHKLLSTIETSPLFVLIDSYENIVGLRPILVAINQKTIYGKSIVLKNSLQGKGLGKAFFLSTLEIIADSKVWGYWGSPFMLTANSEAMRNLLTSLKGSIKMDINDRTWDVKIEMQDIRNFFQK